MKVLNQNKKICSFKISLANIQRLFLAGLVALVLSGLAATGASAQASNVYITQDGGGNGVCSSNVHNPSWFNNSANWGNGGSQIGPGTIVHLCGTITSGLTAQGNGAAGNPWTLFFESGAKMSQPYCGYDGNTGCLNLSGHSFFVIDGGTPCGWINFAQVECNGIIEANANGTDLANHFSPVGNPSLSSGVIIANVHDMEFKNIALQNLYVRVPSNPSNSNSPHDATCGGSNTEGFTGQPPWTNVHIHHVILRHLHWGIGATQANGQNINNFEFDHFVEYNLDHGVGIGVADGGGSNFLFHDFRISPGQTWDTGPVANCNHHDGIHFYGGSNGVVTGINTNIQVYNGLFDGDWGFNNTANIFSEDGQNWVIFNNLFFTSNNALNFPLSNGVFNNANGPSANRSLKFYNNTIIWTQSTQGGFVLSPFYSGTVDVRNNIIINTTNAGSTSLVSRNAATGTWNFNMYSANNPGSGLFGNSSSCCTWTYAQWKANKGADANSPAIGTGTMSVNASTGIPSAGSPVIGAATNLSSLGIAALNVDRNGNARPSSGSWDAGALNSGTSVTNTKISPPTGLTVVVQ